MSRLSMIQRSGGLTYIGSRNHYIQRDEFPILDFKELSICLQGCDFIANEELVSRPSSQYIRTLFEQLLDTFMGFSPEYCVATTKALVTQSADNNSRDAEKQGIDEEDEIGDDIGDTMHTLVLFRAAYTMLQTCGVHDFTLMDLMRPEPQRIRRILSAVINYARFREEHLRECEPLVRICEGNMEEVRKVEDENDRLANEIDRLRGKLHEDEEEQPENGAGHKRSTLPQLKNFNAMLEVELKRLQRSQESLKQEHTQYKERKMRLLEKLEDQHYVIGESTLELEKFKSYSSADPSLLKKIIDDLKSNLQESEERFRALEVSFRNKTKTIDSIQSVEDELRNLIKIVQEIMNDLRKLEDARENMRKQNDDLENKRHTSGELAVHIQRIQRQLQKSEEKIVKLRQQALEREHNAKEKLKNLEVEYTRLVLERDVKEEKLDHTKAEINELESLINAKRSEFDTEWRNTESAVAKLNAHIRLYLSDINNQL